MVLEGKEMVKKVGLHAEEDPSMKRPHDTELIVDAHLAQWTVRVIVAVLGVLGIGLGCAILFGGSERFAGVSYTVALSLPGAPVSWGVTMLGSGIVTTSGVLLGRALLASLGMLIAGFWCLLFSTAFLLAQIRYPQANSTAAWMYASAATVCLIISGVYGATWIARRRATAE